MENKLPPISKELSKQIEREAEGYSREQEADYSRRSVNAYIAGATAYAHYKERFDQAKKVLEQIANAPTPYNLEEMWSWIHTARNLSDKALANWKEEGKEVGGK